MTDEEIRALVNEFNRKVSLDPEIRSVMQKIRNQDADFSDTSRMFWRRSELLRDYLQGIVLDLPAGAREQLCTALLNAGYHETNEVMQSVQQAQDEPQGIHLNPVLPKRPAERIHTVAHALEDPTVPDDKIVRRAGAPVANVNMSFHDKYIEENAKIRAKLGMKPTITRYGSGCCAWCSAVAGRYRFGDQPKDIFRRHDNCGCTIIYDNQVLRGRETSSGRSKTWEEVDPKSVEALGFTPTVFSKEDAENLQNEALSRLTMPGSGDIIEVASNAHARKLELEATIKKCINQDKPFFVDGLLAKYSERIPPEENRYITSMHGTSKSVMLYDQEVDAKILANIIRSRSDYNGEEIVLISCNTGNTDAGENCFAQQLANELGVIVHAPTRYGAVNRKGEYYSSDKSGLKKDGEFKPFEPRREEL